LDTYHGVDFIFFCGKKIIINRTISRGLSTERWKALIIINRTISIGLSTERWKALITIY
jgi:hypothetical protein